MVVENTELMQGPGPSHSKRKIFTAMQSWADLIACIGHCDSKGGGGGGGGSLQFEQCLLGDMIHVALKNDCQCTFYDKMVR